QAAAILALSFGAGAIPFSYLAGRRSRGVDLRRVGTGTVSGASLYRVAGFGPLAAAGGLEGAQGAGGPAGAPPTGPPPGGAGGRRGGGGGPQLVAVPPRRGRAGHLARARRAARRRLAGGCAPACRHDPREGLWRDGGWRPRCGDRPRARACVDTR